jgi:hypothetical protein
MSCCGTAAAMRFDISSRRATRCLAIYLSCGGGGVSRSLVGRIERRIEGERAYPPAVHAEDVDDGDIAVVLRLSHSDL